MDAHRASIAAIDEAIARLLAARSVVVADLRDLKRERGDSLRDGTQECIVMHRAVRAHVDAGGMYSAATVADIFQAVCDGCECL